MATLVRQEVALATTEMTAKAQKAAREAGTASAGGALAHAGFLVLLAALVLALTELGIPLWLSALIIALVTIILGYVLLQKGLGALRRTSVSPRHTIASIKETATWTTRQGA
jgi:uncharacterized protein (DUF983 family)